MIQIKDLTFYYKKKAPLFSGLSLDLSEGNIIGLLGKNGAGKSTLLNLMAGLIESKSGSIAINGFNPFDRKPAFLSDVYFVTEEFGFPHQTIECYVDAFAPLYPFFDTEKLGSILKEFELSPKSNLNKLSHGQRKKFLIAFALATNCKVLILDEPTNGLDIPSKSQFRKILLSSVNEQQMVIISTHQVKDVDTMLDTIVVLDEGKLLFQKETSHITSNYFFETVNSDVIETEVIYKEVCPLGYRIITPVKNGNESALDLELLFNAIINHKIN